MFGWMNSIVAKIKGFDNSVTAPERQAASEEIQRTQDNIQRVNRILLEARRAERIVIQQNVRK